MTDKLDEKDFYELMQTYRHTPITDQKATIKAFEAVKSYIREALQQERKKTIREHGKAIYEQAFKAGWNASKKSLDESQEEGK